MALSSIVLRHRSAYWASAGFFARSLDIGAIELPTSEGPVHHRAKASWCGESVGWVCY